MNRETRLLKNIDWLSILLYILLVFIGLLNIYAAIYNENHNNIFDLTQSYGKQFMWIGTAFALACFIMMIDSKFFTAFSIPIYILVMLSLVTVLILGVESKGARSWFDIGGIRIQPAEFGKFATCLAIANVMSRNGFQIMRLKSICIIGLLLLIPVSLIILQNDTGSALVYSSFILVMYREGLPGSILLLCFIFIAVFILTLLYSSFVVSIIIIAGSLIAFIYYRQRPKEFYKILCIFISALALLVLSNWLLKLQISNLKLLLTAYLLSSLIGLFFIYKRKMKHILSLYYPIENVVPNITNTFNVYLRMENGSGTVGIGDCIASISGQAMAAAAAWDGKITIEETAARFSIGGGLTAKNFTDAIAVETMELVQRSYSDTMKGRTTVGAFCRPVTLT